MPDLVVRGVERSPIGAVSMAGFVRDSRGLPERPLRLLGSYGVVYVIAGNGRFADELGHSLEVSAGDMLLLFPDIAHTYGPASDQRWSELFCVFDGPVFDLWRRCGVLDPERPVSHLEPVDQWAAALGRVFRAIEQPGQDGALGEVCRLQSVLAEALDHVNPPATQDERRWFAAACALLDADPRRQTDLRDIAADLAMSYDGFRKRFRRVAGMPPGRYRSHRAVERACQLMATGEYTDKEVAAKLGFCDEFHFSHRFRELTGRTPRQFRAGLPRLG